MAQPGRKELSEFQDPLKLYEKVTPEALGIPNKDFFARPNERYQKYREVYHASLFGRGFFKLVEPCELRMCVEEQFPDFQMRVGDHVYDFEHTEIDFPGRKRGDEYIQQENDPLCGFPFKPANPEEAAAWISYGLKVKADKRYSIPYHLLASVNFEVKAGIDLKRVRQLCRPYRSQFESIWLLWSVFLIQLFASNHFGLVCGEWNEIPGYREESKKRMGIPS